LDCIGPKHYTTAFVPELGCLGVSFKAASSFCIAGFRIVARCLDAAVLRNRNEIARLGFPKRLDFGI